MIVGKFRREEGKSKDIKLIPIEIVWFQAKSIWYGF